MAPLRVLFVCTGNSARSQMAEGFARLYGEGTLEVFSAGLEPKGLNPAAVSVMRERGINISRQESKALIDTLSMFTRRREPLKHLPLATREEKSADGNRCSRADTGQRSQLL